VQFDDALVTSAIRLLLENELPTADATTQVSAMAEA